ncbi:hypothetical protein FACS1894184_21480 [Clostridia bacterium]|nr:hypothetical protein FACS1894184_21480 [Clostridia bacterium]
MPYLYDQYNTVFSTFNNGCWWCAYVLPLMSGSYMACFVSLIGLVGVSVIIYAGLLVVLKTEIAGMVIGMINVTAHNT